ncbi:hypothetical protein EJ02DRAFT_201296 [Clathrospora elynae]|uniref:Uncharacterized protein n=1 Tax=Clathrospora elynae TaxID=706981 RepID=A0A6A5SLN8_9PLEO|nr:hypothetical protein EJ02DRAFT_201296 [Clathrospora elynae]
MVRLWNLVVLQSTRQPSKHATMGYRRGLSVTWPGRPTDSTNPRSMRHGNGSTSFSKMREFSSFTWESAEEVPRGELQMLWDEGKFDEEIDNYQKVGGWSELVLEDAGYDHNYSQILETKAFENQNDPHNIRTDHPPRGHGTKVGSRVLGQWVQRNLLRWFHFRQSRALLST